MKFGERVARDTLIVFNFVFFFTGIGILIMGAILAAQSDYVSLIGYQVFDICIIMIVAGAITTAICTVGWCGAMKMSTTILFSFAAILIAVVVLETGGSITAFVYQDDIKQDITEEMNSTLPDYKPDDIDDKMSTEWDTLQEKFSCCGPTGPMDWYYANQELPKSCCYDITHDNCDYFQDDHYTNGCVDEIYGQLSDHVWLLAGLALGIAVVQVIGIIISCYLANHIKKFKKERRSSY